MGDVRWVPGVLVVVERRGGPGGGICGGVGVCALCAFVSRVVWARPFRRGGNGVGGGGGADVWGVVAPGSTGEVVAFLVSQVFWGEIYQSTERCRVGVVRRLLGSKMRNGTIV